MNSTAAHAHLRTRVARAMHDRERPGEAWDETQGDIRARYLDNAEAALDSLDPFLADMPPSEPDSTQESAR